MKIIKPLFAISLAALVLMGCSSVNETHQPLHTSSEYYDYIQPSFEQYVDTTSEWLSENRAFIA